MRKLFFYKYSVNYLKLSLLIFGLFCDLLKKIFCQLFSSCVTLSSFPHQDITLTPPTSLNFFITLASSGISEETILQKKKRETDDEMNLF